VGISAAPSTYACPACSTRFVVNPTHSMHPTHPTHPTHPPNAAAASNPTSSKVYRAGCPQCQTPCRFTLPETHARGAVGTRKMQIRCQSCASAFAVQI